jgi:hypothetical protein
MGGVEDEQKLHGCEYTGDYCGQDVDAAPVGLAHVGSIELHGQVRQHGPSQGEHSDVEVSESEACYEEGCPCGVTQEEGVVDEDEGAGPVDRRVLDLNKYKSGVSDAMSER